MGNIEFLKSNRTYSKISPVELSDLKKMNSCLEIVPKDGTARWTEVFEES